jgi:hypothetical protein
VELTWEAVVIVVVLVYGFALSLRFIIAPDAVIRSRQRRLGGDFGKSEHPSVFERIVGTENPRHVRIFGVVTLLWVTFSALFFVMPLWRS